VLLALRLDGKVDIMMPFFFTIPISRMMPISAMTTSRCEDEQHQQRSHAGGRERREYVSG